MFADIVKFIVETVGSLGYVGIFIMMFLESTVFPIPSEVVMIPAGYLAFKGEMNIYIVILLGILGSLGGALFNYYFALKFGRKFLLKYGKYFFMQKRHIDIAFAQKEITIDFVTEADTQLLDLDPLDRHIVSVKSHVFLQDASLFQYTDSHHQVDKFQFTEFARRQKR